MWSDPSYDMWPDPSYDMWLDLSYDFYQIVLAIVIGPLTMTLIRSSIMGLKAASLAVRSSSSSS